ncbi:hypothetical protein LAV72_10870 [Lysinibacillus xylanilyticus]|uniref:hypothetical protein n=1 Tax=Lysinibacillus xylanilyticus TaxID=582475 RepID=UPI002B246B77|nr:hypothetical protein [Lysinibacillus xylanilyticus]MEB2300120.1 hypothetical protein [Lysinibacillus xylanilyticus]
MMDSDSMLFLWQLSFFIFGVTLIVGIFKKSWVFMLISTITFLPIALYFLVGAKNAFKYIGLIPIILFILTILFWFLKRKK